MGNNIGRHIKGILIESLDVYTYVTVNPHTSPEGSPQLQPTLPGAECMQALRGVMGKINCRISKKSYAVCAERGLCSMYGWLGQGSGLL